MTKTDELLAIRTWQRQYEWASDRALRDATALRQRRHLHDLYGQVQVIQLAGEVLRCEVAGTGELFDDLRRASEEVIATAKRLVDTTATTPAIPCAPAIEAGLARVRA
ncbi:MAG: hypothetical protein NT062_29910, partial [Proteobacteria bacterium]|nr:hypothetical protein [Pseudomonadota bacterium]